MIRIHSRSTRTDTLLPCQTLCGISSRVYVDWKKARDTDKAHSHWQAELAAGFDQELAGHRPISLTQARAPDLRTACVNLPASGTAALTELDRKSTRLNSSH